MPDWADKLKQEGMTDAQIKDVLDGKKQKYIEKWGLKSRVGIILNDYNAKLPLQVKDSFCDPPAHSGAVTSRKKKIILNNMPGYTTP